MSISDSQKWFLLAVALVVGGLLYLLAPILTPFLVGALLAYLGDPVADRLERKGLSRTVAVVLVFLTMTLVLLLALLLLVPLIQTQIVLLVQTVPTYFAYVNDRLLPWLETTFGLTPERFDLAALTTWLRMNLTEAGGVAARVMAYITQSGTAIAALLANLLLIPVVTFYLLRDWDVLVAYLRDLLPRSVEADVAHIVREADAVLGAFLRGQLLVMTLLGIVYSVGLWLAGLKFALLIGLLAGLVSFVPYLGVIFGVITASVAMFFQTQELLSLLPVLLVFLVGQTLEGLLLTPLLVGDRIGLHPVAVIFAIMAGGQLFGFMGVLLGLPVAAVLAVVVRDLHRRYLVSGLYQTRDDGSGLPPGKQDGSDIT
ncbi:MAG: AI-2E family transporter [Thiotrichales bacterium]